MATMNASGLSQARTLPIGARLFVPHLGSPLPVSAPNAAWGVSKGAFQPAPPSARSVSVGASTKEGKDRQLDFGNNKNAVRGTAGGVMRLWHAVLFLLLKAIIPLSHPAGHRVHGEGLSRAGQHLPCGGTKEGRLIGIMGKLSLMRNVSRSQYSSVLEGFQACGMGLLKPLHLSHCSLPRSGFLQLSSLLPMMQPRQYVSGSRQDGGRSSGTFNFAVGGGALAIAAVAAGLLVLANAPQPTSPNVFSGRRSLAEYTTKFKTDLARDDPAANQSPGLNP